jgi:hypothetical protein
MPADEVEFYWPQIWYVHLVFVHWKALMIVI